MLARIGAETKQIRIGSGGIMLPHYTPSEGSGVSSGCCMHSTREGWIWGSVALPAEARPRCWHLKRNRKTKMVDDFPDQVRNCWPFLAIIS